MVVHVFGRLAIEASGSALGPRELGGVKPKQILEILLVARGHPVPKERLADLLWGEDLPLNRAAALETYVSVLRRRLDPDRHRCHDLVLTEPGAYRFATDRVALDVDRFDRLLDRAAAAQRQERREYLEAAVSLVRGEILEDEPYSPWVEQMRGRYRTRSVQAMLEAADAAIADGDLVVGLGHAELALAFDHLCEPAYRRVMVCRYALGDQVEALRTFELCERRLLEELAVDPMTDTRELRDAIAVHVSPAALLARIAPDVDVRAVPGVPLDRGNDRSSSGTADDAPAARSIAARSRGGSSVVRAPDS